MNGTLEERVARVRSELAATMAGVPSYMTVVKAESDFAERSIIRELLLCVDILDGTADDDVIHCEGCGRALSEEDKRIVCDDGPELCESCAPEEHRAGMTEGYTRAWADRDIAAARERVRDLLPPEDEPLSARA